MLRRRRPPKNESIHFSFDSFLDLVTNVVGIIIRLILVTWVGARSYHASMQWLEGEPTPTSTPAAKVSSDPLTARLEQSKNDLDDAKSRLLAQIKELELAEAKNEQAQAQLVGLAGRRSELAKEQIALLAAGKLQIGDVQLASLSVEQIRQRSKSLLDELKKLEATPVKQKELKYHAPLSRVVHSEELFFECKAGRVTYIDLPAFIQEVKASMDEISGELKSTWRVERTTRSVGPFRLHFAVARERTALDIGSTPPEGGFRYGLSEWVVEPIVERRGESLREALSAKSEFRQVTDHLDGRISVVTFWVHPDSFEMFRELRDHLYERGLEVAGRPLPPFAPIAASKQGTASRGQ